MKTETVYVINEEVKKFRNIIDEAKKILYEDKYKDKDKEGKILFEAYMTINYLSQAIISFQMLHKKEIEVKE